MGHRLFQIAVYTFIGALLSFFFTYTRSRKSKNRMWAIRHGGSSSMCHTDDRRWYLPVPADAVRELRTDCAGLPDLYGLALVNAKVLGKCGTGVLPDTARYCQLLVCGLWSLFWRQALACCILFYGSVMWYKYERSKNAGCMSLIENLNKLFDSRIRLGIMSPWW